MKKILALSAVLTLLAASLPASAASNNIVVRSRNVASVLNEVVTSASTGGNIAHSGTAFSNTNGGTVENSGSSNKAGNGGNVTLGGMGGMIVTGNALATASVSNDLNSNNTDVEATPWAVGDIRLRSRNVTEVGNGVLTGASSGENAANGSFGHSRAFGGAVVDSNYDNTAGNGGNHTEGGSGGEIRTGAAASHSTVVNVLNRNITRIRK